MDNYDQIPHQHSCFRELNGFALKKARVSERRTNSRNQNISKNIGTMPNIREKLASGKKKLSTKLATGKEKMRAGGEKLKLKVLFLLLITYVTHLLNFKFKVRVVGSKLRKEGRRGDNLGSQFGDSHLSPPGS